MSSRRVPTVPVKTSAAPLLPTNRAVPFRNSFKINAMRSPSTVNTEKSEVGSRAATCKTSAPQSKDLVQSNKMGSKSNASVASTSRPLWQSVKSLGSRVSPGSKQSSKDKNYNKEEQMVSSTGTESSGVFSDSENTEIQLPVSVGSSNNRILRPPQTSTSRLFSAAVAKTTSKLVKRPTPTPNADQALIVELRNQIHSLRNQEREHLEQQERNEKFRNEMTIALAEKESQFQQQLEAKEAAWRAEWTARLEEERADLERQLAEEKAERAQVAQAAAASLADERRTWQQRIDVLLEKTTHLFAEKDRLEKNIRQEVDAQVHATLQSYKQLQKETSSLQAVCELRCQEVRNLRQELEKVSTAAEEVPHLRERITTLGNMVEGLKAQLDQKNLEERRLQSEVTRLESINKEESMTVQRLSMENEQLWYKLNSQQRRPSPTHSHNDCDRTSPTKGHHPQFTSTPGETPKLHRKGLVTPTLSPIIAENGPGRDCENNNNNMPLQVDGNQVKRRRDAGSSSGNEASASSDVDDVFCPATEAATDDASPTVRDFTKKNDSVSYVLDLGGEHSPTGPLPPIPYLTPASPWTPRRNLVRFASLRYSHRPSAHH